MHSSRRTSAFARAVGKLIADAAMRYPRCSSPARRDRKGKRMASGQEMHGAAATRRRAALHGKPQTPHDTRISMVY